MGIQRMERLKAIAARHDLHLIEDAAEAHGAEISGKRVGGLGLVGTSSFYANKIVTTGEGGMITTNHAPLGRLMRRLRDHAFHPERHFWHEYVGFNYRMTNLQAAIGLAQTERMGEIVAARRRLRAWYDERLRALGGLQLPSEAPDCRSVFWMYGICTTPSFGCGRDELRRQLARCAASRRARSSFRCMFSRYTRINSAAIAFPSPSGSAHGGSICRPTRAWKSRTPIGSAGRSRTFTGSRASLTGRDIWTRVRRSRYPDAVAYTRWDKVIRPAAS